MCALSFNVPTLNSRVLLGKLLVPQLLKKFTALHGTRRFITAFTTAHQFFVSWTTQIQFKSFHPISLLSIRIWLSHLLLCLPSYLLPSGFPIKILRAFLSFSTRTTCPVRLSLLELIDLFVEYYKSCSSLYSFLRPPATSSLLTSEPNSLTSSAYVWSLMWENNPKFSRTVKIIKKLPKRNKMNNNVRPWEPQVCPWPYISISTWKCLQQACCSVIICAWSNQSW